MLAKLWKKVLLVICIVACIYNIMSKLISKTSLELNLKSVENGESIFSIFKEKEQESEIIDGVVEPETTPVENITENEESSTPDFIVIY